MPTMVKLHSTAKKIVEQREISEKRLDKNIIKMQKLKSNKL